MKTEISVVVPVYNEEGNIEELYRQVVAALREKQFELIFVNDGSKDRSLAILLNLNKKDKRVKIVNLSRNFGQQPAVVAGLAEAGGEMVATIDADLQDPPEVMVAMMKKIVEGFDVVYGVSKSRRDPPVRKALFKIYYYFMDKLSSFPLPKNAGIFAVMRREVVGVLLTLPERNRFVPALRAWVGFRQVGYSFEKPARFAGREAQNFTKLLKMGLDSLFSFSYVPLRLATYLGLGVSLFAFIVIGDVLYAKFFAGTAILGWASPLFSTLFIGGVELLILGIIGEYLARIYDEVKQRPYYVVSRKVGF